MKPIVTADTLEWSARQVVRMHREPASDDRGTGMCAQCLPGGPCPLLTWATTIVSKDAQGGWFPEREDPERDGEERGSGAAPPYDGYSLGGRFRPVRA